MPSLYSMWMRKTLAASIAYAASEAASVADETVESTRRNLDAAMEPLRADLTDAALVLTVGLVTLGACVLVSALVVTDD